MACISGLGLLLVLSLNRLNPLLETTTITTTINTLKQAINA